MKNLIYVPILFLLACSTSEKKSNPIQESDRLKHGWEVFSGPKATKVVVAQKDSIKKGKALYQTHCLKCHGPKGKGDGPMAQNLKTKPGNISAFTGKQKEHLIMYQIKDESKKEMPRWKNILTKDEIVQLSSYVKSL